MPVGKKARSAYCLPRHWAIPLQYTDLIISRIAGKPLQKILDEDGLDSFLDIEEKVGAELECNSTVIATGGSMVLSEEAMKNLKAQGNVLYINVSAW
jgi:shikimate kinase